MREKGPTICILLLAELNLKCNVRLRNIMLGSLYRANPVNRSKVINRGGGLFA